ncbi:MAG: hypothetical protein ISR65_07945 [Bacteriovoracaceae bacterium]|nr:hypothetical protein [Bacteriovoracaceae bacterium]
MTEKNSISLYSIASLWILPGLIMTLVFNEQPWLGRLGQIIGWGNIASVIIILYSSYKHKLFCSLLIGSTIGLKIYTIMTQQDSVFYIALLNTCFCAAGAVIALRSRTLVYYQLMMFCFINVIFMSLQVIGVGEWAQVFAAGWNYSLTPSNMIFTSYDQLNFLSLYSHYQARPFGLMESNTFLQLIILFSFALYFSQDNKKFAPNFIILCLMAVLAMSKLVFIFLALLIIGLVLTHKKLGYLYIFLFMGCLITLYKILFPGLYVYNLSSNTIMNSIFFRVNNLVDSLGYTNELSWLLRYTPTLGFLKPGEHISGYVSIIKQALIALPAGITALVFYVKMYLKHETVFKTHKKLIWINLLVILLFPMSFSAWRSNIFCFIAGFSLFPLFAVLKPVYLESKQYTEINTKSTCENVL